MEFQIPSPALLFAVRSDNLDLFLEIVNQIFLHFTNHRIDVQTGELVTSDPDDPLSLLFVFGYPGYQTISCMEDLIHHMQNACILRADYLCEQSAAINPVTGPGPKD